jgi:hypothetical protein
MHADLTRAWRVSTVNESSFIGCDPKRGRLAYFDGTLRSLLALGGSVGVSASLETPGLNGTLVSNGTASGNGTTLERRNKRQGSRHG